MRNLTRDEDAEQALVSNRDETSDPFPVGEKERIQFPDDLDGRFNPALIKTVDTGFLGAQMFNPTSCGPSLQAKAREERRRRMERHQRANRQTNLSTMDEPVIILKDLDEVSNASSLSLGSGNEDWGMSQDERWSAAAYALTHRLGHMPRIASEGTILVEGSCSSFINGSYHYVGELDSVGVFEKEQIYNGSKVSFLIHRRKYTDASRQWYLSLGPQSRTGTSHDMDLYTSPSSVGLGAHATFCDELPPRKHWRPVDGSETEGTDGPTLLWIPQKKSYPKHSKLVPNLPQTIAIRPDKVIAKPRKNVFRSFDGSEAKPVHEKGMEPEVTHIDLLKDFWEGLSVVKASLSADTNSTLKTMDSEDSEVHTFQQGTGTNNKYEEIEGLHELGKSAQEI